MLTFHAKDANTCITSQTAGRLRVARRSKVEKGGPLTTSSYSANRDLLMKPVGRGYAGHARIRSWDYDM